MTSAGEYSLLDSGRIGTTFDPMNLAQPSRPRIDRSFNDSKDPPSLDLLAEMIKEEIRQASSLKQALERVNLETESMTQRVSNLSVDMNTDHLSPPAIEPTDKAKKPKKQVQFVVPDDVRFRWLGIFQEPSDSESDNDDSKETAGCIEPAAETATLPHHESNVTCPTSVNKHPKTSSEHAEEQIDGVGAHASMPPGNLNSQNSPSVDMPNHTADVETATSSSTATLEHSPSELAESDSGYMPFTANSSLEAVYGGSQPDTRAPSVLQSAQLNSARKAAAAASQTSAAKNKQQPSSSAHGVKQAVSADRSSSDLSRKHLDRSLAEKSTCQSTELSGTGGKVATISGSRRLSSPTQLSHSHDKDHSVNADRSASDRLLDYSKTVNGKLPFPAVDARTGASSSAFSQPSLATAKAATSKRYSVLPSFDPPQPPKPVPPSQSPPANELASHRPGLQRSGSTQSAALVTPTNSDKQHRRRNSHDGSSVAERAGGLAAQQTSTSKPETAPSRHSGLLRRVTTSSAHRKYNQPRLFNDDSGSRILGGTKDFIKHRLRSRTNSNSLHGADAHETEAADQSSEIQPDDVKYTKRPRRRSDAEVKSRNADVLPPPPPPAIPEQFQQRYPAASKSINGSVADKPDSLQLLHAPRHSIDTQSEWVAVSPPPSSSAHKRDLQTPPSSDSAQNSRKGHDGTERASQDRDSDASQIKRSAGLDSSIKLSQHQIDIIAFDNDTPSTRSRGRRSTQDSSLAPPPQKSRKSAPFINSSSSIGDSPRLEGKNKSPPKMPPLPSASHSPISTVKLDALKSIEKCWQKYWEENHVFEANMPEDENASPEELLAKHPKWMGTIPFPYMNSILHLGHGFTISKVEFAAGWERLQGKNVLFPFGFHASGVPIKVAADKIAHELEAFGPEFKLPAEKAKDTATSLKKKKSKVEAKTGNKEYQFQILQEQGLSNAEIAQFVDTDHWLRHYPSMAMEDIKALGCKIDWRRSFITTDYNPYFDSFAQWQFNRLRSLGKIKFGERYTIWSSKDGQPCMDHDRQSGEDVVPIEYTCVKFKVLEWGLEAQAFIDKIPMIAAKDVYLVAATLYPETIYGVSNCLVNPLLEYGLFLTRDGDVIVASEHAARNMAHQGLLLPPLNKTDDRIGTISGQDLVGARVNVPLDDCSAEVYVLPSESIATDSGTGITMLVDCIKKLSAKEARSKTHDLLISTGKGFVFAEPESQVMSRSGDLCVVALCDQWYFSYSDPEWKALAKKCLDGMKIHCKETRMQMEKALNGLYDWACARAYGLGSKVPWNPIYLIESLSDSTIYMAYYTVAHLLHNSLDGKMVGSLGILPQHMDDAAWDYVLLGKELSQQHSKFNELAELRRSFFIREACDRFGADATRLILADAGDGIDDANFDEKMANAAVLTLYSLLDWVTHAQKALKMADSTPGEPVELGNIKLRPLLSAQTTADLMFNAEMDLMTISTAKEYENTMYRSALKHGLYEFVKCREWYASITTNVGMHPKLLRKYIERQIIHICPITPHITEHIWKTVLCKESSIMDARWPKDLPETPDYSLVTTARLDTLELDDIPSQVIDSGVLNNTVVFGYTYQSGIKVDDIAWDSLTHLVLAFFQVEPSGDVRVSSSSIDSLVAAARKNNVKVLGSIGGAGNGSALLTKALSASKGQDNLAKSLAQIIAKFDLDGVDYDLEFPETSDELANLYDGLKAMRSSLKSSFDEYKLLTMTLYSSRGLFGPKLKQTDAKPFSDIVDYGLLMSYDYFGGFSDISAPNSPFYDIPGYTGLSFTSSISAWLKNGWDAKKLVAGFPFYGRTVIVHNDGKLTTQFMPNSGETAPSGPVNKIPGAWTWSDIRDPEKGALKSAAVPNNGWQRFWDKTTMTPWLFHNASSVYLGYDDPESLSIKANYIITEGLGGAMVWMVQYDYNRELESVMQNYTAACSRISLQAAAAAEASSLAEESSLEAESSSSSMSEEENYDFATGKTCEHESDQSAKDFMLLGGSGVYTAMRTACNGQRVFLLSDHMQRITNSYKQVLGSTLEPSYWRSLLLPILKRGLGRVQGESKITVLVGKENLRVQFTELKAQADSHCWVRLIRGHREDPEAKDLKWVHKRERLEQLIKPPVNEVVLVNWDEKRFFEGLSSNFFAVRQAATYSVPEFRNYKLVSAPLSSVLLGTIMKLVLRICEEDGISVEFVPQLEPELWAGAFVTSTSRLVLPIENVVFGDDGQHEQRLSRDNPLVMHLKLRVEQLMAEQSEVVYK
ncbi:cytosolic leucyl tRNA synthetase [Coemansia sp. RSA 990]|nr:cytosolic leucyl tRNA synthetase [Coemansia sp. RSA 990]